MKAITEHSPLSEILKMNTINYSVLVSMLIVFVLSGCAKTRKTDLAAQNRVAITPEDATLKLSDLFKSYRIVPLQGLPLEDAFNVDVVDSLLVVCGGNEKGEIHLYNLKGKYKDCLVPSGRGADEAYNVQTFRIIDSLTVEILCNFARKLFTYSLKENRIVSQRDLPDEIVGSEDFIKLDSVRYAFFKPRKSLANDEGDEYKINILNLNTNVIEHQYMPITHNDEYIAFGQLRRFHASDGKILCHDVFSPGIYQMYPDSLSLYIAFEEGEYAFPQALLQKEYQSFDEFSDVCDNCPYIWGHVDMAESSKYILSTYLYKNALYLNVINKETMTSKSYTHIYDDLITDATFEAFDVLYTIAATPNAQIFSMSPFSFKEIIEKKKDNGTLAEYQKHYPQPYALSERLSEDDNSLIVLFYE